MFVARHNSDIGDRGTACCWSFWAACEKHSSTNLSLHTGTPAYSAQNVINTENGPSIFRYDKCPAYIICGYVLPQSIYLPPNNPHPRCACYEMMKVAKPSLT